MNRLKSAIILLHFFFVYASISVISKVYQEGEGVEVETVLMPCVLK